MISPSLETGFENFASELGGKAGLAVGPLGSGPIQAMGSLEAGHAWSTMKVPVLVTLLKHDEGSGESLSGEEEGDATLALEQSDNAAAEALFSRLEQLFGGLVSASDVLQQTLSEAGDFSTRINTAPNSQGFTTWGQSIWSVYGEVTFYRALARGCLLNHADTAFVLGLMRNVISSQRWGAGAADYPAPAPLGLKGGWGPENGGGYLVRQTAIIGSGNRGYVLSMVALPSSGSFDDGVSMISAMAGWARQHLPVELGQPSSCGGPE